MSAASCQQAVEGVGNGVAASLHGVDCAAGQMAEVAFGRLFGTHGALLPALTILLTIYVALFAFALVTGRSRIGINSMTSRLVTIGLVLTFATSWIAYQSVVWNLATGAPNELAGILTGTPGNATDVFAAKIDVVFQRLNEAAGNGVAPTSTYSPLGLVWLGGTLILLGTVGILATSRIALAVLLALGPVFVVMALFPGTRGLFTGWLKGVVLLALAPLFAVLGGSFILELSIPILSSLAPVMPGQIAPQAAMAFFLLGAVHVALMTLVLKTAATMVGGWDVFGLASKHSAASSTIADPRRSVEFHSVGSAAAGQARAASSAPRPLIRFASSGQVGANFGGGMAARTDMERGRPAMQPAAATAGLHVSRARGVGSRFRSPRPRQIGKLK
jgi:type IV secretion system protein VirB6